MDLKVLFGQRFGPLASRTRLESRWERRLWRAERARLSRPTAALAVMANKKRARVEVMSLIVKSDLGDEREREREGNDQCQLQRKLKALDARLAPGLGT